MQWSNDSFCPPTPTPIIVSLCRNGKHISAQWFDIKYMRLTDYHNTCIMKLRMIPRSGLTQDIIQVFKCDVLHQRIAQRQVGPVPVYYDGLGVMSCVCGMAFLCGSTVV